MPVQTKTRSFRVEIETPEDDALKGVTYHRHTLLKDDGVTIGLAKDQPQAISFTFADEAATVITYVSPIDGKTKQIAIAEIAAAIAQDYDNRQAAEDAEDAE